MFAKHCEIVCDQDKLKVDIQETIRSYSSIKQWAYILHDKCDTRPHYHIYLNFGQSSIEFSKVAAWFGLAENFVSKVKGRKADMLLYLTHGNDSQLNKYQYDSSEVVSNFDFQSEIEQSKIIGDFDNYSYAQQLNYVNSLPLSEKTKAYTQLRKLWEIYLQCQTMIIDRDISVMFVTGKGGSGKTFYAKRLLQDMNYDFCVSSASNDVFQDYLGQKAIILDDLRDRSFDLVDLLKLLDNNTSSSIRSRYSNKVFNGKLIIITSSVPLNYWYSECRYGGRENLNQLYRRINCYVEIGKQLITVWQAKKGQSCLNLDGKPIGSFKQYANDVATLTAGDHQEIDFNAYFDHIATPIEQHKQLKLEDYILSGEQTEKWKNK